jgi:hypothetical protein
MEVKVGLVSYYIKSIVTNSLFWFALLLYLLSLVNISITSPRSGEEFRGYELLLIGALQTYFGLVTFNILSALPWLGNIAMFLTFIFIYSKQSKKLCLISALFGMACTLSFLFNPYAMLGQNMKLIIVKENTGAYLWVISSVLLFLSALFAQEMPNKKINKD